MGKKLLKRDLENHIDRKNLDIDYEEKNYQELREILDIKICKNCGEEHLGVYSEKYCTDTCEVEYLNKHDYI